MIQKFVNDLLFGIAFGIGFALAQWVAHLLETVFRHAT